MNGDVAPTVALEVIAGLPLGSRTVSMMAAERHGGEWQDWYGKGSEWFALADVNDNLVLNTRATGNWKKAPPEFKPYARPGDKKKKRGTGLMGLYSALSQKHGVVTLQ